MKYRFMRCILFFDLPSVTKTDSKIYRKFVKLIKSEGFMMNQESVYSKICLTQSVVDATLATIKKELPKKGSVAVLTITEKQFNSIELLIGDIKSDVLSTDERITFL